MASVQLSVGWPFCQKAGGLAGPYGSQSSSSADDWGHLLMK